MKTLKQHDYHPSPLPIEGFEERLLIDNPVIDQIHREFVDLINRLDRAADQDLPALFDRFLQHTREHFDTEQRLMEASRFPAIGRHWSEHQRVLTEMAEFAKRLKARPANPDRNYLHERLPRWFEEHVLEMDRILAIHLRYTESQR